MSAFSSLGIFGGPLRVHHINPRYFTNESGRVIYLTGSHTWASLQDILSHETKEFDYSGYVNFMQEYKHNFMRMWIWEQAAWMPGTEEKIMCEPLPFARTGPGTALDEKPKFNLDQWNEEFFERLRSRIIEAGQHGIYVSVMLFQGWSLKKSWLVGEPWKGHPFNINNNINGLDGDSDNDGQGDIHTLDIPSVTAYQEFFIRKVIDTVNDLDNVLYEVINEASDGDKTVEWQFHIINFIHDYESGKPKQHPVGMTPAGNPEEKSLMFTGPADWISPNYIIDEAYKSNPPASDGRKVIISDTDHLWGLGGDYKWVWKSFLRGLNPIFMDPWDQMAGLSEDKNSRDYPDWELFRRNLGYSRIYADRMNLAEMVPHDELVSTTYCLANLGKEYLIYLPEGDKVIVNLTSTEGSFMMEWFNPITGETEVSDEISGGNIHELTSPYFYGSVLHLKIKNNLKEN